MACVQRLIDLPIREEYKTTLMQMCSDPKNADQCEQLCNASDEEILSTMDQMERELARWTKEGTPQEIQDAANRISPEITQEIEGMFSSPDIQEIADYKMTEDAIAGQPPEGIPPSMLANVPQPMDTPLTQPMDTPLTEPMDTPIAPRGYARGGLATLGRFGDNEMVHAQQGEMVIPRAILNQPGAREGIRGLFEATNVNPSRYTVGSRAGSYNPHTGRQEFFLAAVAPILGSVVAQSVIPTTVMSAAMAGALGAAAGTFIAGGDIEDALFTGILGFAANSLFAPEGGFAEKFFGSGAETTGSVAGAELAAEGAIPVEVNNANNVGANIPGPIAGWDKYLDAPTTANTLAIPTLTSNAAIKVADPAALVKGVGFNSFNHNNIVADPHSFTSIAKGGAGSSTAAPAVFDQAVWNNKADSFIGDVLGSDLVKEETVLGWTPKQWKKAGPWIGAGIGGLAILEQMNYNKDNFDVDDAWAATNYKGNYRGYPHLRAGVNPTQITEADRTIKTPDLTSVRTGAITTNGGYYYDPWEDWTYLNQPAYVADGGMVRDGTNAQHDTIPAWLRDGEYVMTPEAVRGAGDGDLSVGAARLNQLMKQLETRRA